VKHPLLIGLALGVSGIARPMPVPPAAVTSLSVAAPGVAHESTPRFVNARVDSRPATAGFPRAFESLVAAQSAPAWIGYSVRAASSRQDSCENCNTTFLEGRPRRTEAEVSKALLEDPGWIAVLFRVEQARVQKIRVVSCDREIDGGGLPVSWFTGVGASDSIATLSRFVTGKATPTVPTASTPSSDVAMTAVALHADPLATTALIAWAKAPNPPEVRTRAIFWLGQKAGLKVAGTLADTAASDPDLAIKERAVFALSRLPGGEGVDKLIEVARTNASLAVRKRALFWLGQSSDPRALEYLVSVLSR
jgi:hypothetical protein